MAMVTPIWQVVGYQNSGKTTFILSLVTYLKSIGRQTAVLKHHGHGGTPDAAAAKDSDKYFQAGVRAALVEGEGVVHLQGRMAQNSLKKSLTVLMAFEPDFIFIEGYKKEPFPKIVLIREEGDLTILKELSNCQALILWPGVDANHELIPSDLPAFLLGEDKPIFEWLMNKLEDMEER